MEHPPSLTKSPNGLNGQEIRETRRNFVGIGRMGWPSPPPDLTLTVSALLNKTGGALARVHVVSAGHTPCLKDAHSREGSLRQDIGLLSGEDAGVRSTGESHEGRSSRSRRITG